MLTCPQQFVTWDFYMVSASRPFFFPSLVLATKCLQDDNNAVCSESLVLPLSVPILSWYFYIHTNILAGSIISLLGYETNALPFICHHHNSWSMLFLEHRKWFQRCLMIFYQQGWPEWFVWLLYCDVESKWKNYLSIIFTGKSFFPK